jgi:hypothetical protein
MSLKKIIDWSVAEADGDCFGTIASPFYELFDTSSQWTYACDVDIGTEEVLRNVPIATNNRDILYAQEGMPVALRKQGPNKFAIVGLSKKCIGNIHILYMDFTDDFGTIVNSENKGFIYRPLTYQEIGSIYGGYGVLPYGVRGKFDMEGNLIELLRSF